MIKYLLVLILLSVPAYGGGFILNAEPDKDVAKDEFTYIIIFRKWEQVQKVSNGSMWFDYQWVTKIQGFSTYEKLVEWLNKPNDVFLGITEGIKQKDVCLTQDEMIGVYELGGKKIPMTLIEEPKVQEKKIVVDRQTWTDREWKRE